MPLFDSAAPLSVQFATLYAVRDALSGLSALQELLEATDASTAKALIIPGPVDPPYNGETFTINELESRICWAQLHPALERRSLLVAQSVATGISSKEGYLRLHIHRQVRQAELEAVGGKSDVWAFVGDRIAKLCEQFVDAVDAAKTNPAGLWAPQIAVDRGPLFNPSSDAGAQGRFIWTDLMLAWGGSGHAE